MKKTTTHPTIQQFRKWWRAQKIQPEAVFVSQATFKRLCNECDQMARRAPGDTALTPTLLFLHGVAIWPTRSHLPQTFWQAPPEFQKTLGSCLRCEQALAACSCMADVLARALGRFKGTIPA